MILNLNNYKDFKETSLSGRYITNNSIKKLKELYICSELGTSEGNNPINYLKLGTGPKKVLIWSQMHGNESTSTKALFDTLSYFSNIDQEILTSLSLHIIPILNPDGASLYTRENINKVDLNRDAYSLTQKESIILRELYDKINPDYCFNLHDQRSIYSVSNNKKPSVLSFLSPSADILKSETKSRLVSMKIISSINHSLDKLIPGCISRYKDDFNKNCVGDTFQSLNTPTLLFESGHYKGDYQRENTRKYMCYALILSLKSIAFNDYKNFDKENYYSIPENSSNLTDIFIRNIKIDSNNEIYRTNVSIMFKEILDIESKKIIFNPYIKSKGDLPGMFGHLDLDFNEIETAFEFNKNTINKIMVYVDKLRIIQ